jgi:hypothetical protein
LIVNVLVFDIETIPDLAGGSRLYGLSGLEDRDIAQVMFSRRNQETGGESDFLRHYLHRIVAISAVLRQGDRITVWSLGTVESSEADLIQRFFDGIERHSPTLVSWNGGGFDLPVLNYRSLLHGIAAPRYWEVGEDDKSFRYNNYLNRFHWRHIDLMDVLANYQARATARLDDIATLLGFPGKMGEEGGQVWERYLAGELAGIRDYCECDCLNTYLVYLRFERIRGQLDEVRYQAETERLRHYLGTEDRDHFKRFLAAWPP